MKHVFLHPLPARFMRRIKDYGLPIAILIGILFYRWLSPLSVAIPYMTVCMLFFTFLKLRPRDLHFAPIHGILALLQIGLALGSYYLLRPLFPESVAQGAFNCFLCPAGSASPVIIGMLGGNIAVGTAYVLLTSIGIAFVGPLLFSLVGEGNMPFWESVINIFVHLLPIVITPLLLAWGLRALVPKWHARLSSLPSVSFWVWVATLAIIIAKTVEFMAQEPRSEIPTMLCLMLVGLIACLLQFGIGKWLSKRFLKESITLGQILGQKNSSLATWMAQVYLNPLSSVAMAAYSIWQNLINSLQLMHESKQQALRERAEKCSNMVLTDKWFTTIASDESGAVVIMNGRLDLDAFRLSGKLKHRIEIRLPYKADEKGMPTREAERIIAQVEELLRPKMERDKLAILTGNHLGGGTKYWVFYARTDRVFFERLNEALEPLPILPLEFDNELDTDWEEYQNMLTMNPEEGDEDDDEEEDLSEE